MAGVITPQGITVRKGDSFMIILHFKTCDGDIDVTDCSLKMSVKDEQGNIMFTKEGAISDAKHGIMTIDLTPEDTDIDVGDYKTDIQMTFADGRVHTVYPQNINAVAYFKITGEVTE